MTWPNKYLRSQELAPVTIGVAGLAGGPYPSPLMIPAASREGPDIGKKHLCGDLARGSGAV
jgi:hypothetical protein